MPEITITAEQERELAELVGHYLENQSRIKSFLEALHVHITESRSLAPLVHSVKRRLKDPGHLKDKLRRKLIEDLEANREFHINKENLLTEINDLGGYRILHLHTRQMDEINKALTGLLDEAQWSIIEGPSANVWDKETQAYFEGIGVAVQFNPRLYSSVHYVIQPKSKIKVTIEIQVRTLSEEVWGEVDHKFNYPHAIDSIPCSEQIKVLARVASSCTRLVDSIFASYADYSQRRDEQASGQPKTPPPGAETAVAAANIPADAAKTENSANRGQK